MLISIATPLVAGPESPTVTLVALTAPAIVPVPTPEPVPCAPLAQQVGALCWRLHKGRTQVLLVTSRDTRRWVLPKGWPIPGLTAEAAAAQEAWEEAGVSGKAASPAIGCYCYDKIRPGANALPCCVDVFALRVQSLKAAFPERKERRRKWFRADAAAGLVAEPELADLMLRLDADPALLAPAFPAKRRKSAG